MTFTVRGEVLLEALNFVVKFYRFSIGRIDPPRVLQRIECGRKIVHVRVKRGQRAIGQSWTVVRCIGFDLKCFAQYRLTECELLTFLLR